MIKLVYEGKNKIIKLEHPTFSQLRTQVKQTYHDLPPDYSLSYLDQDNDQICINSDEDLNILLSAKLKMSKIFIKMSFSTVINMDSFMTEEIRPNFQIYESGIKEQVKKVELKKEETKQVIEEIVQKSEPAFAELVQQNPIIEDPLKQQPAKQQVIQLDSANSEPKEQENDDSDLSESESNKSEKKVEQDPIKLDEKVSSAEVKPTIQIELHSSQQVELKLPQKQEAKQQIEVTHKIQKKDIPQQIFPSQGEEEQPLIQQKRKDNKFYDAVDDDDADFYFSNSERQEQESRKVPEKQQIIEKRHKIFAPLEQVIKIHEEEVEKPKVFELIYHEVACSMCKNDCGIIGIMYQCILCNAFNICQNCEKKSDHHHSLVQVKKAGGAIKRQQIIQKYRKEIFDEPEQRKPLIPAGHYVPSISKDEANRCLRTAENYLKESFERSQKALDDMFLKLSMSHKNPYEVIQKEKQEVLPKKIPTTIEEKAVQLTDFVKITYNEALKFCHKYPRMNFQALLNTYYNELQHYANAKKK